MKNNMPYHGPHKDVIENAARELAGKVIVSGEALRRDIRYTAKILKIDLDQPYDIQQIRKILSKGTPISDIVGETRDEEYKDLS